jgi:hypothetical protein
VPNHARTVPRQRPASSARHGLETFAYAALVGLCLGCEDFEPPATTTRVVEPRDAGGVPTARSQGDAAKSPPAELDAGLAPIAAADALAVPSRSFVLVPDPQARAVVAVSVTTLRAERLSCARAPDRIAASERADLALAVDRAARTACVLDLTQATARSTELAIVAHANRIALSPDARHAVVYHDRLLAQRQGEAAFDPIEVSVIRLAAPAHGATVLVGLRPREVVFTRDGSAAVVISDAGVSLLPLTAAADGDVYPAPLVTWQGEPLPAEATVRVAADGSRALAFAKDGATLQVLDLAAQRASALDLVARDVLGSAALDAGFEPAPPRIADAVIDRSGGRALLALRGEQRLLDIALPQGLASIEDLTLHALPGQPTDRLALAAGAQPRLLVSSDSDARATLWSLAAPHESVRVPLAGPATDVEVDGEGRAFLLAHGPAQTPTGYGVVRVRDGFARSAADSGVTRTTSFSEIAGRLAVLERRSEDTTLTVVDVASLASLEVPLVGEVTTAGLAGAGRYAFVQLAHPDGKLALLDLTDGTIRTVTGYGIADRVQE